VEGGALIGSSARNASPLLYPQAIHKYLLARLQPNINSMTWNKTDIIFLYILLFAAFFRTLASTLTAKASWLSTKQKLCLIGILKLLYYRIRLTSIPAWWKPLRAGKKIGTLTSSISKFVHTLISPLFSFKLCSMATLGNPGPLPLENHVCIVAFTANLQRVSFSSLIEILYYSSTTELILLRKTINKPQCGVCALLQKLPETLGSPIEYLYEGGRFSLHFTAFIFILAFYSHFSQWSPQPSITFLTKTLLNAVLRLIETSAIGFKSFILMPGGLLIKSSSKQVLLFTKFGGLLAID
jgi:hypothetical protein